MIASTLQRAGSVLWAGAWDLLAVLAVLVLLSWSEVIRARRR